MSVREIRGALLRSFLENGLPARIKHSAHQRSPVQRRKPFVLVIECFPFEQIVGVRLLRDVFPDNRILRFCLDGDVYFGSWLESNVITIRVLQTVLDPNLFIQGIGTLDRNLRFFWLGRVRRLDYLFDDSWKSSARFFALLLITHKTSPKPNWLPHSMPDGVISRSGGKRSRLAQIWI